MQAVSLPHVDTSQHSDRARPPRTVHATTDDAQQLTLFDAPNRTRDRATREADRRARQKARRQSESASRQAERTSNEAILDAQAIVRISLVDFNAPDAIEQINAIPDEMRRRCIVMTKDRDPLWPLANAIACDGPMQLELVGWLYGLCWERIRQIQDAGSAKMREDAELAACVEDIRDRQSIADDLELWSEDVQW